MFIFLLDIANCMDRIAQTAYLNITTGEFVEKIDNLVSQSDYVEIPKVDRIELEIAYLNQLNDKNIKIKLLAKKDDKNFDDYFHLTLNNNGLYSDWTSFTQSQLQSIAKEWCEINNIKYTSKQKN